MPPREPAASRKTLQLGRWLDRSVGPVLILLVLGLWIETRRGGQVSPPPAMPEKLIAEQERGLYLTAGGKYTDADIAANGRRTASEAFRGFQARHDFNPQPGDRLCPVTRTKAHPECVWIIDGREYEFCCPPCVDEFLRRAKENPDEILDPDAYIATGKDSAI